MKTVMTDNIVQNSAYQYKFSLVTAVYNVEPFLREAVGSVVAQDIGFEENVQLILVDDGSTDGSGEICDRFAAIWPNNILAVHKKNGGVSSARNEGLKYIEGEYVGFLDADDKLDPDALRKVYDFFSQHSHAVDCVAIPLVFFDGASGSHVLNDKFQKGTRIINLREEYTICQNTMNLFVARAQANKIQFDERLMVAEDLKTCLKLLLEKCCLGVVADTCYWYRRRTTGSLSAVQAIGKGELPSWYIPVMRHVLQDILDYAQERCGHVPMFVQYAVLYEMKWKMNVDFDITKRTLSEDELCEYLQLFYHITKRLDDQVILNQKPNGVYWAEHKAFLLAKKYGHSARFVPVGDDLDIAVHGIKIISLSRCKTVLNFLNMKDDCVFLEGYAGFLGSVDSAEIQIFLRVNQSYDVECSIERSSYFGKPCMDEDIFPAFVFQCQIPKIARFKRMEISICTSVDGICVQRADIRVGKFFPIAKEFKQAYCASNGWMARLRGHALILEQADEKAVALQESQFLAELATVSDAGAREAVRYRMLYHYLKPHCDEEIWLFSDRINKAYDNGEALFRYVCQEKKAVQAYFVLRNDSADYADMKKIGSVLHYLSQEHLLMQLLADKIISASFDDYVINPFFEQGNYYRDIRWKQQQIYLQHGVLHNDLSKLLNRQNKNLSLVITSARRERASILDGNYGYDDRVVRLCGSPRFDRMEDRREKIVTFMPTWRAWLVDHTNEYKIDGMRRCNENLKTSHYFKFYNRLLNDQRLLERAEALGYTIQFMPHPNMVQYIDWFDHALSVKFCHIDTRYYDVFDESSLVITDYSSAVFDFAYLYKPLIYCQFDLEEFRSHHTYQPGIGYFDYERDGFGEVEYTLDDTVRRIIEYMENDCQLKNVYRKRIDDFFAFHDKRNCERTYEAILSLENTRVQDGKADNEDRKAQWLQDVHVCRDFSFQMNFEEILKPKVKTVTKAIMSYVFPCHLFSKGEKVVLYGAGTVGKEFYRLNQKYHFVNMIAVVDQNIEQIIDEDIQVGPLSILSEIDYDSILLAIRFEGIARSAKAALQRAGVPEEKIKWDGTMYHVDDFYRSFYINAKDKLQLEA